MSTRFLLVATMATLAAPASAQTNRLVTPDALTNSYGGINNSIPWGPFVPTGNTQGEIMVQQVEDQLLGRTLMLQGMAFRHSFNSTYVAKAYTAQVTLGDAAGPSNAMSATFASNFRTGGNRTVVLNGVINFPAFSPVPRPPAPFGGVVTFPAYAHTGTDPLLWEVIISQSTPVTPTHFFERGPGGTHTAGWTGAGCTITGGSVALPRRARSLPPR